MKIYKYQDGDPLPEGADIMDIQVQNGKWTIWAAVDPDAPLVPCDVQILPTGAEISEEDMLNYFSTVQIGAYVWHVFVKQVVR